MKVAIRLVLFLAVMGYLVYAVVTFAKPAESMTCEAVDIQITDNTMQEFLTEDHIQALLRKNNVYPEGQEIGKIDIAQIEAFLQADPYIEDARCYHSATRHLCIQVVPQHPVLHVMAQNGEEYYLDRKGLTMPIGNLNIDLCVATGKITKDFAKKELVQLGAYLQQNDFWNKQIEQIHVAADSDIELFPRVGEHTIVLGNMDNYEEKLDRLFTFYRNGLPRVGWNKYTKISLAFDGQIVCTKRETKKH